MNGSSAMPVRSQFLRELHFIEAIKSSQGDRKSPRRSSFGNCTSLRLYHQSPPHIALQSQFLRELHFIEARSCLTSESAA